MTPILSAAGLVKSYDTGGQAVPAVRGVDIEIHEGEFVSLMGPSGCGKSTLLQLLGGLDRPDAGEVRLAGQRVDGLSETRWARLRRSQVGYMFQFFNLIPNLTVADNVEVPALLAGMSTARARARRAELLEALGLADKAGSAPSDLSGGQQQRVALARALVNRPAVLLADEPTGNLDSAGAGDVLSMLRSCNADGQTILLVTHDPRVASSGDRVVRMKDGRITDQTVVDRNANPQSLLRSLVALEA